MPRRAEPTDAPDEALEHWLNGLPRGRALDLGAGRGEVAVWLAGQGYEVDAVEADRRQLRRLRRQAGGRRIQLYPVDLREFEFWPRTYDLVVALAVLHFLPADSLPALADRISGSLRPGGLLIVRTHVQQPAAWQPGGETDPRAQAFPGGVYRALAPGELEGLFASLKIETRETYRWLANAAPGGFRSGTLLVARRPEDSGV